jgi:adhesin HecA-like repeat protein
MPTLLQATTSTLKKAYMLLTADKAVVTMLRLSAVILVSFALTLPLVVVILVAVILSLFVAVISPELLSVLTMRLWLLLACSVPALVIRLVAVLSLLPLLFRFFISLQKMSAKGNIQITSNDEISVNSNIYSEQTLDIHAEHKINVMQGIVSAKNIINIGSEEFNNQSQVIAGLNLDFTQNSRWVLNINTTKVTNQGVIQATANLSLATNELDNQAGGSIVAGNDLSIKKNLNSNGSSDNTATNLITNAGTLHANNNQNIIVNTLNSSGDITATNKLNITATNMTTTSGKVSANDTNITADNLSIVATALSAVNNMALSISNLFTNQGTIQANQQLDISTNTLNNHNLIVANNFILSTVTLNNHRGITLPEFLVSKDILLSNRTSGIIHAKSNLTITANGLDNYNQISSDNILSITTVNDIDNQNAKIVALGNITIKANNFNNQNAKLIAYGVSNWLV